MKLFTTSLIGQLDQYTIEKEPVTEVDLMERAALQISRWIENHFTVASKIVLFAGRGNNGGDALAIARQLADKNFTVSLFLLAGNHDLKGAPAANLHRLKEQGKVTFDVINHINDFPDIGADDIIVDGLFGSGLTRELTDLPAELVRKINALPNKVISIDMPSGLMGENNSGNDPINIIKANHTLTFQFPKISFLLPGNEIYTGQWEVLDIGLHPRGIDQTVSDWHFLEKPDVTGMIPPRSRFAHKGNFGHALLIAGSYGKMGAAVLASRACMKTGAGLLTAHIPHFGYQILQTAVPEAMTTVDVHDSICTEYPDLTPYTAIGAGPGLGIRRNTCRMLYDLISNAKVPLVLDADALNILAIHKEWIDLLPEGTILTPHPGEFARLAGTSQNPWERLQKLRELAVGRKIIIILKGAFTSVALPDGQVYFNSTGNPGMATAGSGDVLTGIILSLLAQNITARDAALAGVFIHGMAGDIASGIGSEQSMIATDIIDALGKAFLQLKSV